jgi:nucleotide-binding universal stress UspA family protein
MIKVTPSGDDAHCLADRTAGPLQKNTMEKILLAMDGYKQNTYAIDFACYLAKLTHSRLTGVFLEGDLEDDEAEIIRMEAPEALEPLEATEPLGAAGPLTAGPLTQSVLATDPVLQRVHRFHEACLSREVAAKVHRDRGVPVDDILVESRFSDLIVVDPETSFRKVDKGFPGRFIRDVLLAAECPVVVSPYQFDGLDEVIFAYNGTSSSVFAIKQFTYLFPEFKRKKAVVVDVHTDGETAIEEQYKMKEWLSAHYLHVDFVLLKGDPSDELFGYLLQRKNAIVVLGAYGRGILSRFLKPSHASLLLRTINLPIFITHR